MATDGRIGVIALALCVGTLAPACAVLPRRPGLDEVAQSRRLTLEALQAQQEGRWEEAEQLLARAVAVCPLDERARAAYAETLWRRGDAEAAIGQLEYAVRLSGGDPALLVRLGQVLLACNRLDEAWRRAAAATAADPQSAGAWTLKGDILRRRSEWDEALACYHRALDCDGAPPAARRAVAEIHLRQGRPRRALAALQALADAYPPGETPPDVLQLEGLALEALERYDEAVERLAAARRRGAEHPELLYHLARVQLEAGRPADAWLTATQALMLDPAHAPCRQLLAAIEARRAGVAAAAPRRPDPERR